MVDHTGDTKAALLGLDLRAEIERGERGWDETKWQKDRERKGKKEESTSEWASLLCHPRIAGDPRAAAAAAALLCQAALPGWGSDRI